MALDSVVYTLIDPENPSNRFDIDGHVQLHFNDETFASFHDTVTRVKRTACASKCFLASNRMWYQLVSDGTDVHQYRHDGATMRRVVYKAPANALSDDEIRELMHAPVEQPMATPSGN